MFLSFLVCFSVLGILYKSDQSNGHSQKNTDILAYSKFSINFMNFWLNQKTSKVYITTEMFYLAVLFTLGCLHYFYVIVKWNWDCFKMLKPRAREYGSHTHKRKKKSIICKEIFSGDLFSRRAQCWMWFVYWQSPTMVQWTSKYHKSNESFPF